MEKELQCFGRTSKSLDEEVKRYADIYTPKFMVVSILSDIQELLDLDRKEEARKRLNCAKYILSVHVKEKPDGTQFA